MKIITYFCGLLLMVSVFTGAHSQGIGCFQMQPYLDPTTNEAVKDEAKCNADNKINLSACWVAEKQGCYWVGSPAHCACLQNNGGTFCNGKLATGEQYGYCQWGSDAQVTACDAWRLEQKHCQYPGYKISSSVPPTVQDYCNMLGGDVRGDICTNFINNQGETIPSCSLDDLFHGKCNSGSPGSAPKAPAAPAQKK